MRSYNFNMEKRERFGFRKYLGLGLCAVTLGAFFMTTTQPVKADTIPNVQTEQVQQEQNKGQPEENKPEVQSNTESAVEDVQGNADQESEPAIQDAQNKQTEGADVQDNASPAEDAKEQQENDSNVEQDDQTTGTATEKQGNATQTKSEQTKQTEEIDNQASQPTKKTMPAKADEDVQKKVHVIYVDASSKVDDSFEQDALDDMTDYSSLPVMSEHDITNSSYDLDKIDKTASSITTDKVKALNDLYEEIGNLDNVNIPTNWKHALNDTQDYHLYSSKSSAITVNNVTTRTDNIYIPLIHQVRWLGRKGTAKGGNSMINVHYPDPKYGEDDLAFYSPIMVSETSGYSTDLVTGKTIPTHWTTSWFCESGDNVNKPFYIHGRLTDTDGHVSYDKGTITIPLYLYGQDLSDIYDLTFKRTDTNDNFITHFDEKNKTLTVQFNAKSYSDLTSKSKTMFFDGEIYFIPKEKQSQVIFYDDTDGGKKLDSDTYIITNKSSNGQLNPIENPIDLSDVHVPEGYELAQGSSIPSQYIFKVNNINGKWIADTTPISVHLVHKIDDKGIDSRTITRTINIIKPGQTTDPDPTVQSVTFNRHVLYDEVTKQTTYGKWDQNSAVFVAVTVPVIDGYTASSTVPETTVTPDSGNIVLTITYKGSNKGKDDPTPTPTPDPDPEPEPEPTNNPDTPAPLPEENPTSDVNEPSDTTVVPKGQKAPEKNPVKPEVAPVKTVHKVNGPVKAEQNITKTPAKAAQFTGHMVKTDVKVAPAKHTATLPQTDEKDDLAIAAVGLTMASVGLLGLKKKKYVHDAN